MTRANVDNGVNVEHLLGARNALTEAREAAQFTWKATNEWLNGTHSRSSVDNYHGLGEEHQHRSTFTLEADHPLVFGAEDNATTPVELVLAGLASCLTAGVAAVAQNREIQLRSVRATAGMFRSQTRAASALTLIRPSVMENSLCTARCTKSPSPGSA